ncbi:hypothetical protein [Maribacter ulvicola]|uniref:LTXXQ motif family protein n=1 Tax=Maribacter ulvicola TaxID=228959 RepID=A0A1N6QXT8_9FLAO|nr:hypothetical protein [Maribacter ulvicola]SIQ21156.1 hypothetical protein SAMN05421797_1011056 [Maribacter ulvicola]
MKTLKVSLVVLVVLLSNLNILAQNKQDEILYAIELADEEYKDIIRYNMNFSESETVEFWSKMNDYLAERKEAFTEEVNFYVTDYSKMTDEEVKKLTKKMTHAEEKKKRIKDKHFSKIRKILPSKKFLRFVQIDYYLEAARNFNISSQMPLIKG